MNYLLELSLGEALLVKRRKKGLTQTQAAKEMGVCKSTYVTRELEKFELGKQSNETIMVSPGTFCMILRRRADMKQSTLAKILGMSRQSLYSMESDKFNPRRLLTHWLDDIEETGSVEYQTVEAQQ